MLTTTVRAQIVLRVDGDDGTPMGNGSSWPAAYKYLRDAIDDARQITEDDFQVVVQVWVAATQPTNAYRPDRDAAAPNGTGNRDDSFNLGDRIELYGGFGASESSLSERNITEHVTVLSGDLLGDDGPGFINNDDNSINVILAQNVGPSALLDGFTITDGNANDFPGGIAWGGGVHCRDDDVSTGGPASPTIGNCTFAGNFAAIGGAGVYCGVNSRAVIRSCAFEGNSTDVSGTSGGAALQSLQAAPAIVKCSFIENESDLGGAVAVTGDSDSMEVALITNCVFTSNVARQSGGAIALVTGGLPADPARATIVNCTFVDNRALGLSGDAQTGHGGALHSRYSTCVISNCTIHDNEAVFGGGISISNAEFAFAEHVAIRNTIIFGNSASGLNGGTPGDQVWVGAILFGFISMDYCDVEGGEADLGGQPEDLTYGDHNITDQPDFEGALSNLRLKGESPCIDAGDPDQLTIPIDEQDVNGDRNTGEPTPDLDLTLRVVNVVDMGAYECNGTSECESDIDGNGATDVLDLLVLLAEWGQAPTLPLTADIAPACGDGAVNVTDLLLLLGAWGPCSASGSVAPPSSVGQCLSQYSDLAEQVGCIEMLIKTGQL